MYKVTLDTKKFASYLSQIAGLRLFEEGSQERARTALPSFPPGTICGFQAEIEESEKI
jgi:hypothetical protein